VNTPNPIRIGLTGGIGSGKSTVAGLLRDMGLAVVDADAISRAVTAPGGAAIPAIRDRFGPGSILPNGAMDRDHMRQRVFDDPEQRLALQDIVLPLVRESMDAQVRQCRGPAVVLDLPLLCEDPHWQEQVQSIWVVDCSVDTQIQRVMARNAWSREQVQAVLRAQCSREQRLALADVVIPNEGDLSTLAATVQRAVAQFGL
jgi:dephospho-CoA kinase